MRVLSSKGLRMQQALLVYTLCVWIFVIPIERMHYADLLIIYRTIFATLNYALFVLRYT